MRNVENLMSDIRLKFSTPEWSETWLRYNLMGYVHKCPRCGNVRISQTNHRNMPYYCVRGCKKRFSVKTNTPFEGSRLTYQQLAIALYLYITNDDLDVNMLYRNLGIT